jgi:hypothetical protein
MHEQGGRAEADADRGQEGETFEHVPSPEMG